jgi:HSP20 family molecular chaperone IbpA
LDRLWRRIAELIDEVIEDFEDEIEREIRRATRWLRDWTAGLGSAGGAIGIASPFADVMTTPDEVRVVVELPGAEKEKIRVWATEGRLTVEAEGPDRRYYKELWLPCEVDPKGARSTYRNGVLEVRLPRKSKGEPIRVD